MWLRRPRRSLLLILTSGFFPSACSACSVLIFMGLPRYTRIPPARRPHVRVPMHQPSAGAKFLAVKRVEKALPFQVAPREPLLADHAAGQQRTVEMDDRKVVQVRAVGRLLLIHLAGALEAMLVVDLPVQRPFAKGQIVHLQFRSQPAGRWYLVQVCGKHKNRQTIRGVWRPSARRTSTIRRRFANARSHDPPRQYVA